MTPLVPHSVAENKDRKATYHVKLVTMVAY
jgi:hypothetical protein